LACAYKRNQKHLDFLIEIREVRVPISNTLIELVEREGLEPSTPAFVEAKYLIFNFLGRRPLIRFETSTGKNGRSPVFPLDHLFSRATALRHRSMGALGN